MVGRDSFLPIEALFEFYNRFVTFKHVFVPSELSRRMRGWHKQADQLGVICELRLLVDGKSLARKNTPFVLKRDPKRLPFPFLKAYHFDRDDVALPGFHKFMLKQSDEDREHAQKVF